MMRYRYPIISFRKVSRFFPSLRRKEEVAAMKQIGQGVWMITRTTPLKSVVGE
jgi:hypothetical protein